MVCNHMKKHIFILLFIFIFASDVNANCRGCCNGHGGVRCVDGITQCADGTDLSAKCAAKGCSVCDEVVDEDVVKDEADTSKNTIKIASFNIQVFGVSKASKPEVMGILASIISQFDVVAIQEIRDKSGRAVKSLEVLIDNLGVNYGLPT